nr:MAG TPA: hypothetical protein [Caudoviricetes sp.]
MRTSFDTETIVDVTPQEIQERFSELLDSYGYEGTTQSEVAFNMSLAAYGTSLMTSIQIFLTGATRYSYMQDELGVMIGVLYNATKDDLDAMRKVADDVIDGQIFSFNDLMKKFS